MSREPHCQEELQHEAEDLERLSAPLGRRLSRIALPLILNSGSMILMMFVDRMFLSWYGVDEISAVWPATFLYLACMTFFYGITSFVNVFVAQFYGAGNKKMCAAAVWQGVYFALGAWLVLLCLIPAGRAAFGAFGHRPEIAALERTYFTVLMAAAVLPQLNNVLAAFFTGRGYSQVTMTANVAGNLVNIVLDYLLIFGHFGFPRWGIFGAALATVIASLVGPAIMFARFLSPKNQPGYATRAMWRFRPELLRRLLRSGAASGTHDVTYFFAVALFFLFMGRTRPEVLAANNIACSVNDLLTLYIHGLSLSATTLLAQSVGRNNYEEAERVIYLVLRILLGMALVVGLVYLLAPEPLLSLFRTRAEGPGSVPFPLILEQGRMVLMYLIPYNFFLAFIYCMRQSLRGAGDTLYFIRVAVFVDALFFLPGIFLVTWRFGASLQVLWSFFLCYLATLAAVHFLRFRSGYWKTIERAGIYERA